MFYFIRTPGWLKKLYPRQLWEMPAGEKNIYLTFDDGPHPLITSYVLDELKKYDAKATFFCIGKNVVQFPGMYKRIIDEGHAVGNHTHDHLNGWKTKAQSYISNITKAKRHIDSNLFRPPYGRITRFQQKVLAAPAYGFNTVMWSVLSGDFDTGITPRQCLNNVLKNTGSGSIVVFHDSEKANERMSYALPLMLKHYSAKGFRFEKILL